MKVHGMFGRMSDLVARIQAVRGAAGATAAKLPESDPLRAQLATAWARFEPPPPCKNAFSKEQEVTEGAKLAAQVYKEMPVLPESDPLRAQLASLSDKADTIRKQIVATKEGGAITGEERLREHMDQLYGALMSYEGKPAATLIAYTGALDRELGDVEGAFAKLQQGDLAAANAALKAKGLPEIALPDHAPTAWRYSGDPDTRAAQERD